MGNLRCKIVLILGFVLVMVLAFPVLAVDYSPGVSTGQYVKYGNFVMIPAPDNPISWTRSDVTQVSGAEVSLRNSGQLEDGEVIPGSGSVTTFNVATGKVNGTLEYTDDYMYGGVFAANLNEGEVMPPPDSGWVVNKTETRTYLGVSRSVNIIEKTGSRSVDIEELGSVANYSYHGTLVFDKISGIVLEFGIVLTQEDPAKIESASYSITETNIFGGSTPTPPSNAALPIEYLYAAAAVAIVVIVGLLIYSKKRNR
jgi:hypothetical protein